MFDVGTASVSMGQFALAAMRMILTMRLESKNESRQ